MHTKMEKQKRQDARGDNAVVEAEIYKNERTFRSRVSKPPDFRLPVRPVLVS